MYILTEKWKKFNDIVSTWFSVSKETFLLSKPLTKKKLNLITNKFSFLF